MPAWRHGILLSGLLACGCAIGPNYSRPDVDTPAQFKETEGWTLARPADGCPSAAGTPPVDGGAATAGTIGLALSGSW